MWRIVATYASQKTPTKLERIFFMVLVQKIKYNGLSKDWLALSIDEVF